MGVSINTYPRRGSGMGRFETVAMQQGERRVLRVKRTLNSCFLCVDQLLKTATSGHYLRADHS